MMLNIKKYIAAILIIWLAAGAISLSLNLYDDSKEREALAFQTARTLLAQLVQTRTWNARHGGVYVPIRPHVQPNPYLDDPERDLTTENGSRLTKINPAYMTRQIAEIAAEQGGAQFHITSLTPVRPENRAADWERKWLEDFQNGSVDHGSFIKTPEGIQFRYMAPLFVNEECLRCHAKQGYGLGDIRGGISLTLPMDVPAINWKMLLSHLLAMVAGSGLILFFGTRLNEGRNKLMAANTSLEDEVQERRQAQKELQQARDHLEEKVQQRIAELSRVNDTLKHEVALRIQAEKALTTIYDEFYQLFNSAPDAMLVVDQNYHIIRVNEAFSRLSGLHVNQIIGRQCSDILKGTTCHSSTCPLSRILKGEKRVELETEKIRTDGQTMPCIVTTTPFKEADGSMIGMIAVVKDITGRKKTEKVLADSAKNLQRSNQALQEFAHIVSHDLQEPLMLIKAFSRKLREKNTTTLAEQSYHYLDRIDSSAGRMQELINSLLQYSRVTSKAGQLEQVDLTEVVNGVLDDLALRIKKTGAAITITNLPVIEADPVQMRQLFQNLIGNSLKYHRPDTIPEISISAKPDEPTSEGVNRIQITVQDNGIGFDPQFKDRIFNIFERLPEGSAYKGSGIGLSICQTIVERHNGSITADSRPGQGAEFRIILPFICCQQNILTGNTQKKTNNK